MATWPVTLPAPSTNYGLNPVDQSIRTDMEVGAARSRRRTTARNDRLTVVWVFSDAQMAIFRAWFEDAAAGAGGGSIWYTDTLPIGTSGKVAVTCRFVGPYKASFLAGNYWQVSADLELR